MFCAIKYPQSLVFVAIYRQCYICMCVSFLFPNSSNGQISYIGRYQIFGSCRMTMWCGPCGPPIPNIFSFHSMLFTWILNMIYIYPRRSQMHKLAFHIYITDVTNWATLGINDPWPLLLANRNQAR